MAVLATTLGQLLINSALPEELRDYERVLDKKGVKELLQQVAEQHPDKYREVSKQLADVGRHAAYTTGGHSFGLRHLRPSLAGKVIRTELQQELRKLLASGLPEEERNTKIVELTQGYRRKLVDAVYNESRDEGNPLASQLLGAGRGNPSSLNSLRGADLLYADHRGDAIPFPVLHGYSEGLTPAEYFAGSFGARKGIIDLKAATADAGFFGKQLVQVAHRLLVTADDDEDPYDEGSPRGLPMETDDPDNEGALLSHPVGGYGRNTLLTPKILKDLRSRGFDEILVRSPTVGGPLDGGVYSRDVGHREKGRAPQGDYVGIAAAQSLSEPLTQAQISSKHCLVRGTLVRMADWSVKPIEQIKIGDYVLGASRDGRTFPVRVVNTFDNGERECVRTFFRYPFNRKKCGIWLESTPEHKVLMLRKVSSCREEIFNGTPQILPVGTKTGRLRAVLANGFDSDVGVFEPMALLIGLLLGDGCYTEAVDSVNFSCFDLLLAADPAVNARAAELNLKLSKLSGHVGDYKFSMIEDSLDGFRNARGQVIHGSRNPLRRWLEARGMFGKYAHEKELPPEVHTWNNTAVAELLGSYFVTDGSVFLPTDHAHCSKPYFAYGSTSEKMLLQVRDLLAWRFGIYASGPYQNDSGERKRPMFYLNINTEDGIRKFHAAIPLYGVKKQRAADMMQNWEVQRPRPLTRMIRERPVPLGPQPTHDIEVDHPDHLFVLANGLIVSNSGGVIGAAAGAIGGFKAINNLVQSPENYPGGAVHAESDGRVQKTTPAPQGGHYVTIGGKQHYVPANLSLLPFKPGDEIEAGDVISSGIPNPARIVEHKGVGEGRRYFVQAFRQAMRDSNTFGHRRNIELIARGLINHVRLDDEVGDWSPGDVVPYQTLERLWEPRAGAVTAPPKQAAGHYLERPALHYSVGTRLTPKTIAQLNKHGVTAVQAHRDPPPFSPQMIRGMTNVTEDEDWQTRFLAGNQQRSLTKAVHRGAVSDTMSTSFVPALAEGSDFGLKGPTKGWTPEM